ncbi:ferredoxin [Streptomyces sp. NPDC050560]|uniref:ferredoxin n=1 Tax=Streptomyces sp. NPDC050560 TaxID=3365630 RepID=UPI00378E4ABB
MRLTVDLSLCQGYGNCVPAAPDLFDLDDAGQAVVLRATLDDPADQAAARAAIPLCPMSAIQLTE